MSDAEPPFQIEVWSDQDHEQLVAEVLYRGEYCLLVTQEEGVDKLRVQIQPPSGDQPWEFGLEEFRRLLKDVALQLWELRTVDEADIPPPDPD
jgi:hypothetical protein